MARHILGCAPTTNSPGHTQHDPAPQLPETAIQAEGKDRGRNSTLQSLYTTERPHTHLTRCHFARIPVCPTAPRSCASSRPVRFSSSSTNALSLAQAPASNSPTLHEIHVDGFKQLTESQIIALTELQLDSPASRESLQAAADKLVGSGLFAHVKYDFHTKGDQVTVNFHVEENSLLPAFFDNIPWFDDSELNAAIKAANPAYDGTLPESGPLVDQAADTIKSLLASRRARRRRHTSSHAKSHRRWQRAILHA